MRQMLDIHDNARYAGFARQLRHLMRARGWNQCDVAVSLVVSQATVSRWCAGTLRPGCGLLIALAELFDVEPRSLWVEDRRYGRA